MSEEQIKEKPILPTNKSIDKAFDNEIDFLNTNVHELQTRLLREILNTLKIIAQK